MEFGIGNLTAFNIIPISIQIAEEGGLIKNKYQKSHQIGLADALIASTAKLEKLKLVTLNVKHFPHFKFLQPPY